MRILVACAAVVLSILGFSSCKTTKQVKTPPPEPPVIPQRDSIFRPPYGEAITMYGTPYRTYEMKDAAPDEDQNLLEQDKNAPSLPTE